MAEHNGFRTVNTPNIYRELASHQQLEQWRFQSVVSELHEWCERFNSSLNLNLNELTLSIEHLGRHREGRFRPSHNSLGLRCEITIDTAHVEMNRSPEGWWRILGTLLKYMIHAWQEMHGSPPLTNGYHNNEFRKKALSVGVIVDERGVVTYAPNSPFLELIGAYGICLPNLLQDKPPKRKKRTSKLGLWVCSCQPPVKVRVGRKSFSAKCLTCNCQFCKSES